MPYDKAYLLTKSDLTNKSHKERFRAIGAACRDAVAASGEPALSKTMWSEYGKCLKAQWKLVPKKPKQPKKK